MIQLTYQAKTIEEFKAMAEWMRENGFNTAPAVQSMPTERKPISAPQQGAREMGPLEKSYCQQSGKKFIRLTAGIIAQCGTSNREEIARLYLDGDLKDTGTDASANGNATPDDGGEVF